MMWSHVIRIPRIIALIGNEAGAFHVLHFATRGVLNDAAPMYSRLVLARGDKNDDGLLEAWELMQMDLRAALVALSACETARGRFGAGESSALTHGKAENIPAPRQRRLN
jgi:CHAT domain-containing protein